MRRLVLFAVLPALVLVLASPFDASAQWYRRYRRADVDASIRSAENTSDQFVKVFDRNLDDSRLNGSDREDRLNEKAKDLENKLDVLRRDFDKRGESWWESRETASDALEYARGINNAMRARRYSPQCERMWYRLRSDLNRIARFYNVPGLR